LTGTVNAAAGRVRIETFAKCGSLTHAAATFLRAIDFADDGFIGNAAYETHVYKLAALEVTR
jgi:hypothetical protein